MQVFRKKYLYNPENPIFESENVRTYNCMNTETKDNRLIILKHLVEPPFVDPTPGVLQPIENPTLSEPYSVYPLVYCCSEIGRVSEADAMYVIKCLVESKMKNPLYCVLSPQGICTSEVEGLLPSRSPSLFQICIDLLGIAANLVDSQDSIVTRDAYNICKGIRDGQNISNLFASYGWNNPKKQKDVQKDDEFWIFKGKRKQQGPFGQQYSLAWLSKFGLAKFKYIDLAKDGYEEQFYQEYLKKIEFYQKNEEKDVNTVSVYKYAKEPKGIKIFLELLNQGTINEYIEKRKQAGRPLNEQTAVPMLQDFATSMKRLTQVEGVRAHGSLHSKNLYVHDHRIVIGEPLLITDKIQKKLRELKTTFDFYAPQMKENIILPQNLMKLSFEKMDLWSFGFLLHKVITRDLPAFDASRKPVLAKSLFSPGMLDLITRCLSLTPSARPSWQQINLKDLQKPAIVEQFIEQENRSVVRLGTSKEGSSKRSEVKKQKSVIYSQIKEDQIINLSVKGNNKIEQEEIKLKEHEEEEEKFVSPIPIELSLRLKRIKLIGKIIIVMVLYFCVFFRDFIGGSLGILLVRNYYSTASLNLVDTTNTLISTTVIITHQPDYFLLNDISFSDIQDVYSCINNQFDPIYNPDYALIDYVKSSNFLVLLLLGWAFCLVICITKAVSIWKGGISNKPNKSLFKYYVVYGFHQLSLASLLYSHFYLFQFFYFASGTPCFSIKSFTGISPFFDSSLYLFLMNTGGYLSQVFSSLGVLAILLLLSSCYYAWGPKLDQKYFLSVPSILFRLIPYVLLIIICRIGVFTLFGPSAMNDSSQMIPAIVKNSSNGFFGIIPEIFVAICIVAQLSLELFFYWCQRKAAQSDKLAGLFNIHSKKVVGNLEDSNAQLNDMSIVNNQPPVSNNQLFD